MAARMCGNMRLLFDKHDAPLVVVRFGLKSKY